MDVGEKINILYINGNHAKHFKEYIENSLNLNFLMEEKFSVVIEEKKNLLNSVCSASVEKIKSSSEFQNMKDYQQKYEISPPTYSLSKIQKQISETESVIEYWVEAKVNIKLEGTWNEQ